jgi:hypothetical protein
LFHLTYALEVKCWWFCYVCNQNNKELGTEFFSLVNMIRLNLLLTNCECWPFVWYTHNIKGRQNQGSKQFFFSSLTGPRDFFFQFHEVGELAGKSSMRWLSQIWLQGRENSRVFLKHCANLQKSIV